MSNESSRNNGGGSESIEDAGVGVMGTAQDAAEKVRQSAERAAERLPEAVATAQVAARDTQKALEDMPNQALIIGTSFSLGLGVGLFLTGFNRILVLLALAPAAAMAATLVSRESDAQAGPTNFSGDGLEA
ncbi:hypothetical protein BH24CHL7_BH24CHL7_07690 [soil metagenome]|jgi:hypothetical protein